MLKSLTLASFLTFALAYESFPAYEFDCIGCIAGDNSAASYQYCETSSFGYRGMCDYSFSKCSEVWTHSDLQQCFNSYGTALKMQFADPGFSYSFSAFAIEYVHNKEIFFKARERGGKVRLLMTNNNPFKILLKFNPELQFFENYRLESSNSVISYRQYVMEAGTTETFFIVGQSSGGYYINVS